MKKALVATLLLLSASTVSAATYVSVHGAPDPGIGANQTVIDDFEGGMASPPAGIVYGGSYTIDALTVSGVRAPPAGDTTNYFATPGSEQPLPGIATIDFSGYIAANRAFSSLSFYWGSVDSYNTLELLNSAGNVYQTIFGTDINNPANGNQSDPATNQRLFLHFAQGEDFAGLRLTSTQRAFEIDNIAAAAVPEPAIWGLMLAGFGMVGFAARRRNSRQIVTA
ncbi:MAG: PEPxxWA-CTERM sorting domain-containing protein [Bradyrhizobium sp.]